MCSPFQRKRLNRRRSLCLRQVSHYRPSRRTRASDFCAVGRGKRPGGLLVANTPRTKGILVAVEGIRLWKDHSGALVDGEIPEPRSGRDFAFLTMMMCSDKLFSAHSNLPAGWLRPDTATIPCSGRPCRGGEDHIASPCLCRAGRHGMQALAMPEFCSGPLGNYLRDEALQDKIQHAAAAKRSS
jgi:hypothetical protein